MILIMEGTNDIRSGFPLQTTKLNLQLMIDKAKARGVVPILSTLTPSDQRNSEVVIPNSYNPMIRKLAEQTSLIVVDQYSAVAKIWPALNDDGIHPNDDGYIYLAKTWDQTIEKLISPTGEFEDPRRGSIQLIAIGAAACFFLYFLFRKRNKRNYHTRLIPLKVKRNR
jgi:lysophospholipase L1-like esterase